MSCRFITLQHGFSGGTLEGRHANTIPQSSGEWSGLSTSGAILHAQDVPRYMSSTFVYNRAEYDLEVNPSVFQMCDWTYHAHQGPGEPVYVRCATTSTNYIIRYSVDDFTFSDVSARGPPFELSDSEYKKHAYSRDRGPGRFFRSRCAPFKFAIVDIKPA